MIVCIEKTKHVGLKGRMIRISTRDRSVVLETPATLELLDKLKRRKRAFFYAAKSGTTINIESETSTQTWKP